MKRFAFALSLLASGLVYAQTTPPATGQGPGRHGHMRPPHPPGNPDDMFEARLTRNLGLSATQQNTVHTVLAERRVTTKGLGTQMQSLHTQMIAAVKSGDESQIEKVTTELSNLRQQEESAHAKAIAKIYSGLTADQKTKVGANLELLMGRGGMGFGGPGFGPGRRGGPPLNGSATTPGAVKQ
jgi:Spy/CpxP family protein refolding chaperone